MLETNESRPSGAAPEPCSDSSGTDDSRSPRPADTGEQWQPISGYLGLYDVSNHGRVWSRPRRVNDARGHQYTRPGRILAHAHDHVGHSVVNLHRDGVMRQHRVRTLVLGAFVGPRPAGLECRSRNGDYSDCSLANLTYGTHSEIMRSVVDNGHHAQAGRTHCPAGHPYDAENTSAGWVDGRLRRHCRTCRRARARARSASSGGDRT